MLNFLTFVAGTISMIMALTADEVSFLIAINAGLGIAAWISMVYIWRKQPGNL